MKFTFKNVFEKRQEFELACKKANACQPEYKRLVSAKTEEDFMQVICDNFGWINKEIKLFEPKFDGAYSFLNGFTIVKSNDKYGYLKSDGEYLVEPKFDYADYFKEGFAKVRLNGEWYNLNTKGGIV